MRQGEVWEMQFGKVLVVSADTHNHNPHNAPVVVPIVRGHGNPVGAAVAVSTADPVSAVILSTLVAAIERPSSGNPIGIVTGHTMHQVMTQIENLFHY